MDYAGLDTTGMEVSGNSDTLPAGEHKVIIAEEKWVDLDAGRKLLITCEAVEGAHAGETRTVWLDLLGNNPKAKGVAVDTVIKIGEATGRAVNTSNPLVGRVFIAKFKRNGDYINLDYHNLKSAEVTEDEF